MRPKDKIKLANSGKFGNIHHIFVSDIWSSTYISSMLNFATYLPIHFFLLNLHLEVDVEMDFKKCFLKSNYTLLQVYIANY